MIAGALPAKGGGQTAVFRTPVFVVILALLSCSLLLCCRRRLRWRETAFLLTHLGVVVVLVGAFLGFVLGRKTQFAAPIAAEHAIREIPGPDPNVTIELPFDIAVTHFDVQFYPPIYHLYTPPSLPAPQDDAEPNNEYAYQKDVRILPDNTLDLEGDDHITAESLQDDQGNWVRQFVLPSGRLLQMGDPTPKHYEAVIRVTDPEGESRTERLAVNQPLSHRGWRFYLMSYDRETRRYIWLSARHDPGRSAVIAGIWAIILGIAALCWRPLKGEPDAEY